MKVQHPLLWPCIFALVFANASAATRESRHEPRQGGVLNPPQQNPSGSTNLPNTNTQVTPPPASQTANPPPTTTPGTTTTPPAPNTSTTGAPATTTPTDTTTSIPTTTTPPTVEPTPTPIVSEISSDGSVITVTSTPPLTSSTPSSSAAPSDSGDDGGGGLSTGSIIGMSVAAGVAVIGIVGFFVWKFTRKRFSDFDDNEAIKWPELNTHSGGGPDAHALPARETGRSGFDTGSEADLSRVNSTSNYSTPDFGAGGPDPYAVPPLPHLNPNQPYRDDPSAGTGFYDPYRGPVPGTLEHGADWQTGEAYPMTQFGNPQARASPAPDYMSYDTGRQSPAAHMYGRSSPAPQAAYGGRASPGPQAAYSGRASPGPGTAYDAYGAR